MAVPPSTVPGTMANSSALDPYYDPRAKLERSQQDVQDMREKFLTARATVYFLANRLQRHGCEKYKDLIASVLEEKPDFEEMRSAARLGGQDSLVQARARELTHLRRKIQEGREVCSLFAQHLKDTGQAFEGLLRSTDVACHLGQRFCEQLAQGSQLAESLARKLTAENHNDQKSGDREETLAQRPHREHQGEGGSVEPEDAVDERYLTPSGQRNCDQPSSRDTVLSEAQEATSAEDAGQDEMQKLQQHLKETMVVNVSLRQMLQRHLSTVDRDRGCTSNLYWQVLDSIVQLYDENRVLREKYQRLPVCRNPACRGNN
ncbi:neuroblastoma breakpoint family member 6-like protein [Oryctolagus cuniculus]|uniref:neuroblastoma breakpoint family member 6-like protein n=1 Tax=Oryctolagus cuniculus TaxID=9986 RepID=UPI00387993AD